MRSSECTAFENRLDKSCQLELDGRDLFNGCTSFVGCVHRIACATAHSAGPDEGPCAAFRCFPASPLGILRPMDASGGCLHVKAAPSRCRLNGCPRS